MTRKKGNIQKFAGGLKHTRHAKVLAYAESRNQEDPGVSEREGVKERL